MALGFDLLLIARCSLICVLPDRQDFMLYGIYLAKSLVLGAGWVGGGEVEPGLFGTPPVSPPPSPSEFGFGNYEGGRAGNFAS